MTRWTKWTLFAILMALPALGYAVTQVGAAGDCPITDCPCNHH